ncbi:MAG: Ku protein [Pseudomonadota bacterium]
MAIRAISSATISFGLVSIPVKLFSASDSSKTVRFNQIDRRDGSRLKQQMISAKSGEVVPQEEIFKGYEFAKNQYVLFEPDELKACRRLRVGLDQGPTSAKLVTFEIKEEFAFLKSSHGVL